MKRKMKKLLVTLLSAIMLVGSLTITAAAEGEGNTAFLMFTDTNWAYGNWDATLESATTTVTGAGDYSVKLNVADMTGVVVSEDGAAGAKVFCVDVIGLGGTAYEATNVKVIADGVEFPIDTAKVAQGDIEENGNFRIEIYNEFGLTVNDAPFDPTTLTFTESLEVQFTLVEKTAPSYTAFLMFTDRNWAYGNWDAALESATTTVTGDGSYSVVLNTADMAADVVAEGGAAGAQVFCVDVLGLGADCDYTAVTVSDVKVIADGTEFAIDDSKLAWGDIEENGNFRLELYNEFGTTVSDPAFDPTTLTFVDTLEVQFTLNGIVLGTAPAAEDEPVEDVPAGPTFDPNATYNAYLLLQTPNWTFRDAWNDANGIGSENWGPWVKNNDSGETYGVVTDAVIDGNGTFTVKITDMGSVFADDFTAAGQEWFNIIGISTDIPFTDEVKITNVETKMDGKVVDTQDVAYQNPDKEDYFSIIIQNIWNKDKAELSYYAAPTTSLEISFTIEGFANDSAAAGGDAATDAPSTDATTTPDASTNAPADNNDESGDDNTIIIIVVVAVVVVAAVAVAVVVSKKKKAK